ncbi:MAG: ABC transporter ATP-binding protein [Clostridia bacterium]|nr:ABC transporter ATP-binding protein [Clostridia bacterium]
MNILDVRNLRKQYPGFLLDDVSFTVEDGSIMGFIGRNGAGKTTTIKGILNLLHVDGGQVLFEGKDLHANETACKERIGLVLGEFNYYKRKKLSAIAQVTRRFYADWDETLYQSLLTRFSLDTEKKISELSQGMRTKFAIALALSHHAKLFILDEPTSGLDPVSRDELLEIFRSIIEDGEHSILFSTHIISDLEKCADFITYLKGGRVLCSTDADSFKDAYRLVSGEAEQLERFRDRLIGYRAHAFGFTGLMKKEDAERAEGLKIAPADMESIMIYTEKEDDHESAAL